MSRITDVADALVAGLNAYGFTMMFTSVRSYLPTYKLTDMKTLHVTIVAQGVEMEQVSRLETQYDVKIDIGVQKKLANAGNAEIDALANLVEEIVDYVQSTRIFGSGMWIKSENAPIYSPEHLSELRQFTSVVTLTFRLIKP